MGFLIKRICQSRSRDGLVLSVLQSTTCYKTQRCTFSCCRSPTMTFGGETPLKNTHYQGSYRFLSLDRESLNIKIDLCGAAIAAPYTVICALMPFSDDLGGGKNPEIVLKSNVFWFFAIFTCTVIFPTPC